MNTEHEFHVDSFVGYIENIKDKRDRYILVEFMAKFFKAAELRMRNEIVDEYKQKFEKQIENNKLKVRDGAYSVKLELTVNINLEEPYKKDQALLNEQMQNLTFAEQDCFEWKLTLNESKYKKVKELGKLEDINYCILDMVVEKFGTPKLEIKKAF
jgi:hypothetical protein